MTKHNQHYPPGVLFKTEHLSNAFQKTRGKKQKNNFKASSEQIN